MDETERSEGGAIPVRRDDERDEAGPTPEQATEGEKPLEAEIETRESNLFPPDVDPTVDIGGGPEERGALDEEFRR
jgi:hypothetical protein